MEGEGEEQREKEGEGEGEGERERERGGEALSITTCVFFVALTAAWSCLRTDTARLVCC